MVRVALDNDVAVKGACYGLLANLIAAIPAATSEIGVLGASVYVVPAKIRRARLNANSAMAVTQFENLIKNAHLLEPSAEETSLAAEIELIAQEENLALDSGESQLCAIAIIRELDRFVTGDKRAIQSLETATGKNNVRTKIAGRILCLEQVFARLLIQEDGAIVRKSVCHEPEIDQALSICFACSSPKVEPEDWRRGLESYIADIRKKAPSMLAP